MDITLEELRTLKQEVAEERKQITAKRGQRLLEMAHLHYVEKKSLAEIGKQYGLSRQRVHQILQDV